MLAVGVRSMWTAVVILPFSNRIDLVRDAQLFEDVGRHVMHGGLADSSLFPDCFTGKSCGHALHQSVFAWRERSAA